MYGMAPCRGQGLNWGQRSKELPFASDPGREAACAAWPLGQEVVQPADDPC